MKNVRRLTLALSLMISQLLAPMAATADGDEQAPKPLTWISYVKSQTGKAMAVSKNLAESGAKTYDPLMADGRILTWGVGLPINHRAADDWNVMEWVTFRDWAAVDAFMQGFMAMQMAKSPEEMLAEQAEWQSLVEPGSHHDEILRHMVVVPAAGKRPAYYDLAYFPAKPGQSEALRKLWVDNIQPTMAKLQAADVIYSFGLAETEVHDGSGPGVLTWTAMPNLAARDAIDAASDAAAEARGEDAQKELMMSFAATVDAAAHHDRIIMVTHYGGGNGGDGGK